MLTIDGVEYKKTGRLDCVKGSGDNQEQWHFDVLELPNGGRYLMNTDKQQSWLYLLYASGDPNIEIETVYETSLVDTMSGALTPQQKKSHKDLEFRWVGFKERFADAPLPFQDTSQGLTVGRQGKSPSETYMSIPLLRRGRDTFYTPHFPASELPPENVEAFKRSKAGAGLEAVVGIASLLAMVWGVLNSDPTPLSLVWWLGPVAGICYIFSTRAGVFYDSLRFLVGAYLLHFSTHCIDTTVTTDYWREPPAIAFETTRFGIILLILLLCRMASVKVYSTLVDGCYRGAGCAWWLFATGLAMWGIFDEFNSFEWFRWYSGVLPWGAIWAIFMILAVSEKWFDYRDAPLNKRTLRRCLNQLSEATSQGLQAVARQAEKLGATANNLEDAVRVSNDSAVASLFPLGPAFLSLETMINTLSNMDLESLNERETDRINQDLKTVSEDLAALLTNFHDWGTDGQTVTLPRLSPFLLTYGK